MSGRPLGPLSRWGIRASVVRRLLAVLICLSTLTATPAVAEAQEEAAAATSPPKQGSSLTVTFEPSTMTGVPHYVTAKLVSDDGSSVVGERISIRRTADVFGGRTVVLGRATTDNAGLARVPIEPREAVYHVTASYSGNETLASSEVIDDIVFPPELVILPQHAPQGGIVDPQLRPLADTMPLAIGGTVIVIWVILLALALATLASIRSSGRGDRFARAASSAESPGTGPGSQERDA